MKNAQTTQFAKVSFKKDLNHGQLKEFTTSALWSRFQCWLVKHWAYNLENGQGHKLWDSVKAGRAFSYQDNDIQVRILGSEEKGYSALFGANVKFESGIRKVAKSFVDSTPDKAEKPVKEAATATSAKSGSTPAKKSAKKAEKSNKPAKAKKAVNLNTVKALPAGHFWALTDKDGKSVKISDKGTKSDAKKAWLADNKRKALPRGSKITACAS